MTIYNQSQDWTIEIRHVSKAITRPGLFGRRVFMMGLAIAYPPDREAAGPFEFDFEYEGKANERPEEFIKAMQHDAYCIYMSQKEPERNDLYTFAKRWFPRIDTASESDKPTVMPPPGYGHQPKASGPISKPPTGGSSIQRPAATLPLPPLHQRVHDDYVKMYPHCTCIPHRGTRGSDGSKTEPGVTCKCGRGQSYSLPS